MVKKANKNFLSATGMWIKKTKQVNNKVYGVKGLKKAGFITNPIEPET